MRSSSTPISLALALLLALPAHGAIDLSGAAANHPDVAADSSWDSLTTFSMIFIVNLDTAANNDRFFRIDNAVWQSTVKFNDNNDINFEVGRATTDSVCESSDNFLSTGSWVYIVLAYSPGNGCSIFHGGPASAAVEATYSTETVGTGATDSASGAILGIMGAGTNVSANADGKISLFRMLDVELDLQGAVRYQYDGGCTADTVILHDYWSTTTPIDRCGLGNSATMEGTATVTDPAPIP